MTGGRIAAEADQLRAAWRAGRSHGRMGGSRSADPFIHGAGRTGDRDLHIAWDEGWIAGAEEHDRRLASDETGRSPETHTSGEDDPA